MKHMFKPGEKEAVAAILGIPAEEMPDVLNLAAEEDEDEDDEDTEDEEAEDEEDDEDDEDDDEDDEDDSEDDDAEDTQSNVELLRLKEEWERTASSAIPFSDFLKSRGK